MPGTGRGGDIVPVPPRSGELAPESCAGQNTPRVSTAGTRTGLATAEEMGTPLPPKCLSGLREIPESALKYCDGGPRPLTGNFSASGSRLARAS